MTPVSRLTGRREAHGLAPVVDGGEPPSSLLLLVRELRPTPGRLSNTVRVTLLCLVTISMSETFRIPMTVLSAALVFFMSTKDTGSSVLTALLMGISALAGVLLTLLVFSLSLSQPALRIALIAFATFAAMFLSRASSLGPALFACGFITAYGLTFGDDVLGAALQPITVSNTTQDGLPGLVFMPPEEALVHSILWIAVAVAVPALVVITGNLLIGRDPTLMLRSALADRLATAAAYCEGDNAAYSKLAALSREGSASLLRLHALAVRLHRTPRRRPPSEALIIDVERLLVNLLAWRRVASHHPAGGALTVTAALCRAGERVVRNGGSLGRDSIRAAEQEDSGAMTLVAAGLIQPLRYELRQIADAIGKELAHDSRSDPRALPDVTQSPRRLFFEDAFTNREHSRFALKVTLAIMMCYVLKDLTAWPGIQTCIVTCFLVALGTTAESAYKAVLRLAGACVGGALGIGAILLIMPSLTDLSGLLLLLAPVLLMSAWIASGSERISYCGMQIALGFLVAVIQGFGPTLDMQTARDRIIGVLIGDVAVLAVFTTVWPVRVDIAIRERLADALARLADLLELPYRGDDDTLRSRKDRLLRQFGGSISQASSLLAKDHFATGKAARARDRGVIDAELLGKVQQLLVPVSVILEDPEEQQQGRCHGAGSDRDAGRRYKAALSAWLKSCSQWVRTGKNWPEVASSFPELPLDTGTSAWYKLLYLDLRSLIRGVEPANMAGAAAHPTLGPQDAGA